MSTAKNSNKAELPYVIVGRYYTNLAMVLHKMNIPYLVTDYRGEFIYSKTTQTRNSLPINSM